MAGRRRYRLLRAVRSALTTSETRRRKPSAATRPRLAARARIRRETVVLFWFGTPDNVECLLHLGEDTRSSDDRGDNSYECGKKP